MGRKRGPDLDDATDSARGPRRRKGDLPSKPCQHCNRPMEWRRKWADHWAEVRYCSKRCAGEAKAARAAERKKP